MPRSAPRLRSVPALLAAVIALVLVAAGCGGSSSDNSSGNPVGSGTVPLHVVRSSNSVLALVPVSISGKGPFLFALDTGASNSLVDSRIVQRLGLAPSSKTNQVSGVACRTTVHPLTISNWSAGNIALPKTTVSTTKLPGASPAQGGLAGLLGSDVLRRFDTVTIDYASGKLRLGKAAGLSTSNTVSVPLKVISSGGATIVLAPVELRGKGPYPFALDTGAAHSTIDTDAASKVGLTLHQSGTEVTGVACQSSVKKTTIRQWSVGKVSLPTTVFNAVNIPEQNGPGLAGLLGSDILSTFDAVTVDYAHSQLRLPSPASASASGTVPLRVRGGNRATFALVPVTIGGHGPYAFGLDTGAAQTVVSARVAQAAGLQRTGSTERLQGVLGTERAYPARISSWRLGSSVQLKTRRVLVANLPSSERIDGLIGADVLSDFGAITVDYSDQQLQVGSAVSVPNSAVAVPLRIIATNGAVRALVPIHIQGHQTVFALDTGASRSAVASRVAQQLNLPVVATGRNIGGVTTRGKVSIVKVSSWSVGQRNLPTSRLAVLSLQGGAATGLLGSDILSRFGHVTIDFRHERLLLPPAS